jgi:hypothetical protein
MAITIADNQGNAIDQNNPLPVDLTTSEAIIPVDIQNRLISTIQTHNAVSVPLSSSSENTNWVDTDGFTDIGVTFLIGTAGLSSQLSLRWSNDGANGHGFETPITSGTGSQRTGLVPTKARYVKVTCTNLDATSANTMSAWVYLKA